MPFDTKCYELAEYFLEDAPGAKSSMTPKLAQRIQDVIEDYIQDDDNYPHQEPPFDTRRERDEWRHEASAAQRLK